MAQNNNLPAQANAKPITIRATLQQMTPEFKKALPGHIPVERFVRTVQTALQMNPQIASAATKTEGGMQSLLAACIKAATDGLIIDGREAALVTFRQKVSKRNEPDRWEDRIQYLPMVAGLLKKVRNSGEIRGIQAEIVFEKDFFKEIKGDDAKIIHEPYDEGDDRGAPVKVYAIARLKSGEVQREVMRKSQVMRIAAQSKNPDQYDPTKGKNYEEWWRKTVIRRISKYLPSSSDRDEFMRAVERIDEDFDFASNQELEIESANGTGQPTRKKRGGAAAALKDITPKQKAAQEPNHDEETGEIYDTEYYDRGNEYDIDERRPGDDI